MENWGDKGVPFEEFTEEITNQWKNRGFTYLQCKEWLDIGCKFTDFELVRWLRNDKKVSAEWLLNYGNYEVLKKEFLSSRESLEETLITQTLTVLDVWKDNSAGEEKKDIRQVIKNLAGDQGTKKEQCQSVEELLTKYPSFTNRKLTDYLSQWFKLLEVDEEEETILPPWLFADETEVKTPTVKTTKPSNKSKSSEEKKPWECRICEKRKFFSKAEFIKAHGVNCDKPSVWVYTTTQPDKNEPLFVSKWLCKICKEEEHNSNCKYYREIKLIIPSPEIFNWENYWKWWFGVHTLDWYEKRFFGKY